MNESVETYIKICNSSGCNFIRTQDEKEVVFSQFGNMGDSIIIKYNKDYNQL